MIETTSVSSATKLSWFSPKRLSGYTDYFDIGRLIIYYNPTEVLSNAVFNSPNAALYQYASNPDYIEDIATLTKEAWDLYKQKFPDWTDRKVQIYVHPINQDGFVSPPFNTINLNRDLKFKMMRSICAHELLHVVQDSYYSQLILGLNRLPYVNFWKWWWEALAVNADQFVYPNVEYHQAVAFANNSLPDNLGKAWDDCPTNPEYYVAGGFLYYLQTAGEGTNTHGSIPLDSLLTYVGTQNNFSDVKTSVDKLIQKHGTDIGEEYMEYLKWAYEAKNSIKLKSSFIPQSDELWQKRITINNSKAIFPEEVSIPNLGVRCLKVFNTHSIWKTVLVSNKNTDTDVEVYAYKVTNPGKGNEAKAPGRRIPSGSHSVFKVFGDKECIDVLIFNKSKDTPQNASIELASYPPVDDFAIKSKVNAKYEITINGETLDYQTWGSSSQGVTLGGYYGWSYIDVAPPRMKGIINRSGYSRSKFVLIVELEFNQGMDQIQSFCLTDSIFSLDTLYRSQYEEHIYSSFTGNKIDYLEYSNDYWNVFGISDQKACSHITHLSYEMKQWNDVENAYQIIKLKSFDCQADSYIEINFHGR